MADSARADDAPVKLAPMEEAGVVTAGVGGAALAAGSILMAMGFDRRAPQNTQGPADEVLIALPIMISGAVLLGVGIPLALVGKAKREAKEKKNAWIVPTIGGAVAFVCF